LIERFANFGPDRILRIIKPALPGCIRDIDPIFTDDGNQDTALGDSLFDDL